MKMTHCLSEMSQGLTDVRCSVTEKGSILHQPWHWTSGFKVSSYTTSNVNFFVRKIIYILQRFRHAMIRVRTLPITNYKHFSACYRSTGFICSKRPDPILCVSRDPCFPYFNSTVFIRLMKGDEWSKFVIFTFSNYALISFFQSLNIMDIWVMLPRLMTLLTLMGKSMYFSTHRDATFYVLTISV